MDISSINLLRINLIYGTVCEQCSKESCPTMSGGAKFEYLWQVGCQFDFIHQGSSTSITKALCTACKYKVQPYSQYDLGTDNVSKFNLLKDGVKYKKPVHLPAPQYIALLMDWVSLRISNEHFSFNLSSGGDTDQR